MDKTRDKTVLAAAARKIRRYIVEMTYRAGSGHPGGSLSSAEILTALYLGEMTYKPEDPTWPDRDRFVLSKGHACPVLYATLAHVGVIGVETLNTLRKLGSVLQGHPDMTKTPGVEISSGSLGQGLSVSNGMALAGKLDRKDYRVYVLMGDGEQQEGEVWEAAMTGSFRRLDNLVGIVDYNGLQIDGPVSKVKEIAPLADKWRAFGWHVLEIDGHDYDRIFAAFDEARRTKGKPTMIVARTVKGKGVSFMENQVGFHGRSPKEDEYRKAMAELAD